MPTELESSYLYPEKTQENFFYTIPENLWQSDFWKKFHLSLGNKSFWIQEKRARSLIIERKPHPLKFWKKPYWEIPRGPIGNEEDFPVLVESILKQAKASNIEKVRIYPPFNQKKFWQQNNRVIQNNSHQNAPEIFPEHTLILNLNNSEEEILSQMKPKGRYNIKVAVKKGVEIFEEKNINNFWSLLKQTTQRDGFTPNKKKVYEKMIKSFGDNAVLLTAKDQTGEILASKIFVRTQKTAIYYYGSSSNRKRNLMAPYLLQWKAIEWAKKNGCDTYDFLGISPEENKSHSLSSVSSFKLKFGGERVISDKGIDFLV